MTSTTSIATKHGSDVVGSITEKAVDLKV